MDDMVKAQQLGKAGQSTPERQSTVEMLSESMDKEMDALVGAMGTLATRLSPVRLMTPTPEKEKSTASQAMSPLCTKIGGWRDRVQAVRLCVEEMMEELEI